MEQEINGGPFLHRAAIAENVDALSKIQYGVRITWQKDASVNEPVSTYAFDELSQACSFAAFYDPETAPAQRAARVQFVFREAIEVYGDWASHEEND